MSLHYVSQPSQTVPGTHEIWMEHADGHARHCLIRDVPEHDINEYLADIVAEENDLDRTTNTDLIWDFNRNLWAIRAPGRYEPY